MPSSSPSSRRIGWKLPSRRPADALPRSTGYAIDAFCHNCRRVIDLFDPFLTHEKVKKSIGGFEVKNISFTPKNTLFDLFDYPLSRQNFLSSKPEPDTPSSVCIYTKRSQKVNKPRENEKSRWKHVRNHRQTGTGTSPASERSAVQYHAHMRKSSPKKKKS